MIPVERLRAVRKILTHARCPDGMASAMILHDALPEAEVVFLEHGSAAYENLAAEPGMLFCDIAPPRARVDEFVAAGAIVLDHHRSQRDLVEKFELHRFADEVENPGVSGALLAFRVWADATGGIPGAERVATAVRDFAQRAGVRDTFQRNSPDWLDACAQAETLMFYSSEHWLVSHPPYLLDHELALGRALFKRNLADAKRAAKKAWKVSVAPDCMLAVVQERFVSDIAETLRDQGVQLCAGFSYESELGAIKCTWSLRSDGSVDVGAFCRERGGGGHTCAAGFTEVAADCLPHVRIASLLVDYLARSRS